MCLVLTSRFVDHGDMQRTQGKNTHDGKGMYGWIGDTNFPSQDASWYRVQCHAKKHSDVATVREWDLCNLGGQVRPPKDRGV